MAERSTQGGGHKVPATQLPDKQKEEIKKMLQFDLTAALIASIKANPPEVDLAHVEILMPAAGQTFDLSKLRGDCGTCGTSRGIKQTVIEVS
jgi:hypothetical protein